MERWWICYRCSNSMRNFPHWRGVFWFYMFVWRETLCINVRKLKKCWMRDVRWSKTGKCARGERKTFSQSESVWTQYLFWLLFTINTRILQVPMISSTKYNKFNSLSVCLPIFICCESHNTLRKMLYGTTCKITRKWQRKMISQESLNAMIS